MSNLFISKDIYYTSILLRCLVGESNKYLVWKWMQVHDLLYSCNGSCTSTIIQMGPVGSYVELVEEKVENPTDFARILKIGLQKRGVEHNSADRCKHSHLYVSHILSLQCKAMVLLSNFYMSRRPFLLVLFENLCLHVS